MNLYLVPTSPIWAIGATCDNYQNISQEIIDLLDSPSYSVLTEESIVKLVEHPTYPSERR